MAQVPNAFTEQDAQYFRDIITFEDGFGVIADAAWNVGSGSGNAASSSSSVATFWNGVYFPDPNYNFKFANGNVDDTAFIVGTNNVTASGAYGSFAMGSNATASGNNSFALGLAVTASGASGSFAQGVYTSAGAFGSFAQGEKATNAGTYGTFAQGLYATVTGNRGCFAQGYLQLLQASMVHLHKETT